MKSYLIDFGMAIFGLFLVGFTLRLVIQRLIWGLSGTQQGVFEGTQRLILRYRIAPFLTQAPEQDLRQFALALVMRGYAGWEDVPANQCSNADEIEMLTRIKNETWEEIRSMDKSRAMGVISNFIDDHHPSLTRNVYGDFRHKGHPKEFGRQDGNEKF
jgi:hypothetical protein